jgi:hypothetical protein
MMSGQLQDCMKTTDAGISGLATTRVILETPGQNLHPRVSPRHQIYPASKIWKRFRCKHHDIEKKFAVAFKIHVLFSDFCAEEEYLNEPSWSRADKLGTPAMTPAMRTEFLYDPASEDGAL